MLQSLKSHPYTEDFVYLRRIEESGLDYKPYSLEVVPYSKVDPDDFYTMSVRGMTHYINGASHDYSTLDSWERQARLFVALKRLRLFRMHRTWKALRVYTGDGRVESCANTA